MPENTQINYTRQQFVDKLRTFQPHKFRTVSDEKILQAALQVEPALAGRTFKPEPTEDPSFFEALYQPSKEFAYRLPQTAAISLFGTLNILDPSEIREKLRNDIISDARDYSQGLIEEDPELQEYQRWAGENPFEWSRAFEGAMFASTFSSVLTSMGTVMAAGMIGGMFGGVGAIAGAFSAGYALEGSEAYQAAYEEAKRLGFSQEEIEDKANEALVMYGVASGVLEAIVPLSILRMSGFGARVANRSFGRYNAKVLTAAMKEPAKKAAEVARGAISELALENLSIASRIGRMARFSTLMQLSEAGTEGLQYLTEQAIIDGHVAGKTLTIPWLKKQLAASEFSQSVFGGLQGGGFFSGLATVRRGMGVNPKQAAETIDMLRRIQPKSEKNDIIYARSVNNILQDSQFSHGEKVEFAKKLTELDAKFYQKGIPEAPVVVEEVKIDKLEDVVEPKKAKKKVEPVKKKPAKKEPVQEIKEQKIPEQKISEQPSIADAAVKIPNVASQIVAGKNTAYAGNTPAEQLLTYFSRPQKAGKVISQPLQDFQNMSEKEKTNVTDHLILALKKLDPKQFGVKLQTGTGVFNTINLLGKKGIKPVFGKEAGGLAGEVTTARLVKTTKPTKAKEEKVDTTFPELGAKGETDVIKRISAKVGTGLSKLTFLKEDTRKRFRIEFNKIKATKDMSKLLSFEEKVDSNIEKYKRATKKIEINFKEHGIVDKQTIRKTLENMGKLDPEIKPLVDLLKPLIPEQSIVSLLPTSPDFAVSGRYSPASKNVDFNVNLSKNAMKAVALHEFVHAATYDVIDNVSKGNLKSYSKAQIQAVTDLNATIEAVKTSIGKEKIVEFSKLIKDKKFRSAKPDEWLKVRNKYYALTRDSNLEFVADVFTKQEFRDFLKTVKMPGRKTSAWIEVKKIIKQVLGIDITKDTALARTLDSSLDLLRPTTKEETPVAEKAVKVEVEERIADAKKEVARTQTKPAGKGKEKNFGMKRSVETEEKRQPGIFYQDEIILFNNIKYKVDVTSVPEADVLSQLESGGEIIEPDTGEVTLEDRHYDLIALEGQDITEREEAEVDIPAKSVIGAKLLKTAALTADRTALDESGLQGKAGVETLDNGGTLEDFETEQDITEETDNREGISYVDEIEDEMQYNPTSLLETIFFGELGVYLTRLEYKILMGHVRANKGISFLDDNVFNSYFNNFVRKVESISGANLEIPANRMTEIKKKIKTFHQRANSQIEIGPDGKMKTEIILDENGNLEDIRRESLENLITEKKNPARESMNFLQEDGITIVYLPMKNVFKRKKGVEGDVFEQGKVQLSTDLIRQIEKKLSEIYLSEVEFNKDGKPSGESILFSVLAETQGDNSQLVLSLAPNKYEGYTKKQFEVYVQNEVDKKRMTEIQQTAMLDDYEIGEVNSPAQIISAHETLKKAKGNEYLLREENVAESFKRLKLDLAKGIVVRGIGDSSIMIVNVKGKNIRFTAPDKNGIEETVRHMKEDNEYAWDGWMMTSLDYMKRLSKGSGINTNNIKTVIRTLNDKGYAAFKMMEMIPFRGMKVYEGDKLIAQYDGNTWVDAKGTKFDRLATNEELKDKDGVYKEFNTIHTLPENATRVMQFPAKSSPTGAHPINGWDLMVTTKMLVSEEGKALYKAIKDHYNLKAVDYISAMIKLSGDPKAFREFVARDMTTGEIPPELQRYAQLASGKALYLASVMKFILPMLNNRFFNDGLWKGRPYKKNIATKLLIKPSVGMELANDEIMVSSDNLALRNQVFDRMDEGLKIKELYKRGDGHRAIRLANDWLSENDFWVLVHRQPIQSGAKVQPRKIKRLVEGSHGMTAFLSIEDVWNVHEADHDGDTIFLERITDDSGLINRMLEYQQTDEFKKSNKSVLLKIFKTELSGTTMASRQHRHQQINNNMAVEGAQGIIVSAKNLLNVAFNKGISFKVRGDNKTYSALDPEELTTMDYWELDYSKKNKEMIDQFIRDNSAELVPVGDKYHIRTTREHEFSMLLQAAVDNAKFGLIGMIPVLQVPNVTLFDFIKTRTWSNIDVFNQAASTVATAIQTTINYGRRRKGRDKYGNNLDFNGNFDNSESIYAHNYKDVDGKQVPLTKQETIDIFSETAKSLLTRDNKKLFGGLDMIHFTTPTEELLSSMALGRQYQFAKEWAKGNVTGRLFEYSDNRNKWAHEYGKRELGDRIKPLFDQITRAVEESKDPKATLKEFHSVRVFMKNVYSEYRSILRKETKGKDVSITRHDFSEDFVKFIDKHSQRFRELSPLMQKWATVSFLHGLIPDPSGKNRYTSRTLNLLKLLPIQLLDSSVLEIYAEGYWKGLHVESVNDLVSPKTGDEANVLTDLFKPVSTLWKKYNDSVTNTVESEDETTNSNFEEESMQRAFESDVNLKLDEFMGTQEEAKRWYAEGDKLNKKALASWNELRLSLMNHMTSMARKLGFVDYSVEDKMRQYQDYIQTFLKTPTIMHNTVDRTISARRIIAVNKILNGLIKLHETRLGKALSGIERAYMPVAIFAMRADPFGKLYDYAKRVVSLGETSRNRTSPYRSEYNGLMAKYRDYIDNIVGSHKGMFDKSWAMDGIRVGDNMGKPIVFYGSETREAGEIVHKIKRILGGKETLKETPFEYISSNELANVDIGNAIINKYTYEHLDNVMHGETRHVTWQDTPVDEEDRKEIAWYINELTHRIKKDEKDKDLGQGMQEIHSMTTKDGWKFRYIMLHDGKKWNAYIIQHIEPGKNGKRVYYYDEFEERKTEGIKDDKKLRGILVGTKEKKFENLFRNGYYKASEYRSFGDRFVRGENNKGYFIEGGKDRGWYFGENAKDSYMENQPHKSLAQMKTPVSSPDRLDLSHMVVGLRGLYDRIGMAISKDAQREQDKMEVWLDEDADGNSKLKTMLTNYMGEEPSTAVLKALQETFDIGNRIWIDNDGNVHTPNSHFKMMGYTDKRGGNIFSPTIYEDADLTFMLRTQRDDMLTDLSKLKDPVTGKVADNNLKKAKELEKMITQFDLTMARREHMDEREKDLEAMLKREEGPRSSVNIAEKAVHTQHRSNWADPSMRSRESDVFDRYVHNTFHSLEKNKLMIGMLDTMENVIKTGEFQADAIDWLINRTRVSFVDPQAMAKVHGIDISNERFAKFLNKLPGSNTWTARSAMRLITTTKGLITQALLGSAGALNNRTQIINDVISFGVNKWRQSGEALDSTASKAKWMAVIDNAGTDEVINMFMDHMADTVDLTWRDAGTYKIPLLPIQIPTFKFARFLNMTRKSRKSFIENGMPELDKFLNEFEDARYKRTKDKEKRMAEMEEKLERGLKTLTNKERRKIRKNLNELEAEESKYKTEKERRNIKALREAFVDFLLTKKEDNNKEVTAARYTRLMGQVADDRAKKFISWKLGWWPKTYGTEIFTFTGGERLMRRQTAIMALMTADEQGLLGDSDETTPYTVMDEETGLSVTTIVHNRFLSPTAVRIAREGVANSMFGMSAVYLGDAFLGLGAHFGLYKAYPLQQMLHDYRQLKLLTSGSMGFFDGMDRLRDAASFLIKQGADGRKKYDITQDGPDHDAIAAVRFLLTRVGMTGLTIAAEAVPMFRQFLRSSWSGQIGSMIRGGENPGLAIMFRLLFNLIYFAHADDDNFERSDEMLFDIMRLFLPVFLTWPSMWVYQEFIE